MREIQILLQTSPPQKKLESDSKIYYFEEDISCLKNIC
jgi:hypothetical protein